MRAHALPLVVLLGVLPSAACAPQDVIVAQVLDAGPEAEAGDDSAAEAGPDVAPDAPGSCTSPDDCPPNAFCSRNACSDARGQCEIRPITCDDGFDPSCGCDGVSYWNDCLRKRAGTTASTKGQCSVGATTCGGPAPPCPVPGASCAHLVPPGGPCPMMFPGVCWLLPDSCPPPGSPQPPDHWVKCGSQPPECADTCNAIRSGEPHQSVPACP